MRLYEALRKQEEQNKEIGVGIVGAGQMGRALAAQLAYVPALTLKAICARHYEHAAHAAQMYEEASRTAGVHVCDDLEEVICHPEVSIVVEATGDTDAGARVAELCLREKKHLILLNVEVDITIGPYLYQRFQEEGLIYTGSDGDEPAVTLDLVYFAKSMGLEVLVAGKGKNNALNPYANPDTAREEALAKHMNPHMLCAFQDGTKTMAEMTLLANATGFIPDVSGMHGVKADLDTTLDKLALKEEGGCLNQYGVVEYVDGLAPGVFVMVRAPHPVLAVEMNYLLMKGERDRHILYRPFHLASLETALTIAKVALYQETAITPLGAPVAETVAYTKKAIQKGETLDGIGGYCFRGMMETHEQAHQNGYVPIGLLTDKAVATRDIPADSYLRWEDVALDETADVVRLRRAQDRYFNE